MSEPRELSEEDAYIIDFLQKGQSQKEIAKFLGKEESTISKKISALRDAGIIVSYPSATVNISKLVRFIVYGLIKLKLEKGGVDWIELATLISRTSPKIVEVGPLFASEWDILIKCYVNSLEEYYDDIVKRIHADFDVHGMTSFILFRPPKYDHRVPRDCLNIKKVEG